MNILQLLIHSVKLLYKRVCVNFQCQLLCIRVMHLIFKKSYIYPTKNLVYITKPYTESSLVNRVENVQTHETIADDTLAGPPSGMDR